jgi:hypothetical protein
VLKLKKTITHLDEDLYQKIEAGFQRNRAENFLYLFRSYRKGNTTDAAISQHLELSSNSFYVLKSRLYDKVQEYLSGNMHLNKEEIFRLLHRIPDMIFNSSREVCTAFLLKLEKDLLHFDMHNELLLVYSALKKINQHSDKYFHYSQQYNKHMAFTMSLEKSEEILGNFTRALGNYNFSRSSRQLETLRFLQKGINDHLALNESRQIEVIRNFIEIQLDVFCDIAPDANSTEENLRNTERILSDLPESSAYKSWQTALDYLFFEYFRKINDQKMTRHYFDRLEAKRKHLLLYNTICFSSRYLSSRTLYLQQCGATELLADDDESEYMLDENDTHATISLALYKAMIWYYKKQYKEAAAVLNHIINVHSFKDYFHISTDIRLNLAFLYILLREFELADNLLKNIQRKIKSEKLEQYNNVLDLIRVLNTDIKNGGSKIDARQQDNYLLFMGRNRQEKHILGHLLFELNKRYS